MYFFHIIFILFFLHLQAINVVQYLNSIPSQDRQNIERVFIELIKNDHFAYSLFGDKPVSLSSHFILTPWENIIEHMPTDRIFWKNWESWKKYRDLFLSHKYLILEEKSKTEKFEIISIMMINKEALIEVVNKNSKIFSVVLNKKIEGQQFLDEIETGKIGFIEAINNSQILWGILLGYGTHNSFLYAIRDRPYLWSLSHLNKYLLENCSDSVFMPFHLNSVYFAGDSKHPETIYLKNKYKKMRGEISAIYNQGDFLEITLRQFTQSK